jgi:hypothetical protein
MLGFVKGHGLEGAMNRRHINPPGPVEPNRRSDLVNRRLNWSPTPSQIHTCCHGNSEHRTIQEKPTVSHRESNFLSVLVICIDIGQGLPHFTTEDLLQIGSARPSTAE